MIHSLKALGLALVAVFAMSALAASAAQAVTTDGEFTSDGAVTVTGHGTEKLTFEATQSFTCTGHHTVMPENQTPWASFNPGVGLTTLTDQAHYSNCVAQVGAQTLPATVTTNECDFLLHFDETTAPLNTGTYTVTPTVKCKNQGETIEIHVYQQASHAFSICTYKVGEQNLAPGTLHSTNIAGGMIEVSGEVTGITASRTGVQCGGTTETNAAIQHVKTILTGRNGGGGSTAISITH